MLLRQFIAASAIALTSAAASAGSIIVTGETAEPNSVSYIGYDSFDASGNPICTPCLEQTAEEASRLKAYAERRARSREYMARMQGNAAPANPLLAARASEPIAAGKSIPAPDLTEAPMRAGVN